MKKHFVQKHFVFSKKHYVFSKKHFVLFKKTPCTFEKINPTKKLQIHIKKIIKTKTTQ